MMLQVNSPSWSCMAAYYRISSWRCGHQISELVSRPVCLALQCTLALTLVVHMDPNAPVPDLFLHDLEFSIPDCSF